MKASRLWIALPLVVAMAACAGDDADVDTAAIDTETGTTMAPAPAAPAAPAAGAGQTATLSPIGDSGIAGEATITDRGTQTEVMVRLTGAPPSGSHPGHIHSGTCDNIGGVVQPLQPITTDATGTGTMTTSVDAPAMTVMNGQHVVVYHGAGGAPATCAAIPMHAM